MYPIEKTIHQLFEEQVKKTPNAIALVSEKTDITYRELNEKANHLAHYLKQSLQVKTGDLIAICFDKSIYVTIAILAILKAGGAYVPVDPNYPDERIAHLLKDTSTKLVLTASVYFNKLKTIVKKTNLLTTLINLDSKTFEAENSSHNPDDLLEHVKANDLAYVIYTSGTTGKPKGSLNEHGAFVNRANFLIQHYSYQAEDVFLQKTSYVFDVSAWEILVPLFCGAKIILCTEEETKNLEMLYRLIEKYKTTRLHFTPSLLQVFIDGLEENQQNERDFTALKTIFSAGEALSVALVKKLKSQLPHVAIHNIYGPSEADITYFDNAQNCSLKNIPIGKPIDHATCYVLDENLNQLKEEIGELYIGGIGLARGYLNQATLTKKRFIANPFQTAEEKKLGINARLYKTGDLVKKLADGNLEYIGRNDFQVKIRGYRVELGEIEQVLNEYEGIKYSVVVPYTQNTSISLVAYYVSKRELSEKNVLAYLRKRLPDYMVPRLCMHLDVLPININGKLDRNALPQPDFINEQEYIPARNKLEKKLVAIWSKALDLPENKIGIKTSFFRLGGNSLSAMKIAFKLKQEFLSDIEGVTLFLHDTVGKLSHYLEKNQSEAIKIKPIATKGQQYLSFAQQRLWFIDQYESKTTAYNISLCYTINSNINLSLLEASLHDVIARHEILHSVIQPNEEGEAYQIPMDISLQPFKIKQIKLFGKNALHQALDRDAAQYFELINDYPIRTTIYLDEESNQYYLSIVVHHIAFDGWSIDIFLKDLWAFYQYRSQQVPVINLPAMPIQYKDFAVWQKNYLTKEQVNNHLSYWQNLLKDYETLNLSIDKIRPAHFNSSGRNVAFELSEITSKKLHELAQACGVSLYTVMLAGYYLFLNAYSSQTDIVLGTSIANRQYSELENIIGFFVNTLALRIQFSGHDTVYSLIKKVWQLILDAQIHQDLPFEKLVEALAIPKDASRHPIFQVMFGMQSLHKVVNNNFLTYYVSDQVNEPAKFDLSTFIDDSNTALKVKFNYAEKLFNLETAQRFAKTYQLILEQFAKLLEEDQLHSRKITDVNLVTEQSCQKTLYEWNNTNQAYAFNKTIHSLFEEQVNKTPNQVAVVVEGKEITYLELNKQANQLANYLKCHHQVRSDDLIVLCLDRNEDMLASMLGVLKSGAAYVPVDPNYPDERIKYILEDTRSQLVLTEEKYQQRLSVLIEASKLLNLNDHKNRELIANASLQNPVPQADSKNLAYVIYTSGTTGKPKGVMTEHQAVVNRLSYFRNNLQIEKNFNILGKTSYVFDASCREFYLALSSGAKLFLLSESQRKSPEEIYKAIKQNAIHLALFVPSQLRQFIHYLKEEHAQIANLSSLKYLYVSGEVLLQEDVNAIFNVIPAIKIKNQFGSTECCMIQFENEIVAAQNGKYSISVGKPIANSKAYVLNQDLKPVEIGAIGELYIGGEGLARGYLHQVKLTKEKFIANPFQSEEEKRIGQNSKLYKTGDRVRWLDSGELEYIGRNDFQIKIRGNRVEPSEIESVLNKFAGIKQSVILADSQSNQNTFLVAYYLAPTQLDEESIFNFLKKELPEFMIPSALVHLEQFPLTVNGKLDRKSLPKISITANQTYIAPTTKLQKELVEIWAYILQLPSEKISINSNFFRLGGNSLSVVRLVSKINQALKTSVTIADIFAYSSISALSFYLSKLKPSMLSIPKISVNEVCKQKLSFAQERLWFIDKYESGSSVYNLSMCYVLDKNINYNLFLASLKKVVSRHEMLHSIIKEDQEGNAYQEVVNEEFLIEQIHIKNQYELHAILNKKASHIFKLDKEYPIKLTLAHAKESNLYYLIILVHHIAFDGWSVDIFLNDLQAFYQEKQDISHALPPLAIQYKDFALWQRSYFTKQHLEKELDYWKKQLEDYEPLNLVTDYIRPNKFNYEGAEVYFKLEKEISDKLRNLAKICNVSLYSVLLAAYTLLLKAYSSQNDVTLGGVVANRSFSEIEDLIGIFVNSLALRVKVNSHESLYSYIQRVSTLVIEAQIHQNLPFEMLVNELQLPKDTSRHPLFQVMFTVQSFGQSADENFLTPYMIDNFVPIAKYDLSTYMDDSMPYLQGRFNYATSLFKEETIHNFIQTYKQILNEFAVSLEKENFKVSQVSKINYLNKSDYQKILVDWNKNEKAYPIDQSLQAVFENQAAENPHRIAVICGNKKMTYQELNQAANCLAHYLKENYLIKANDLIGVCLDRSDSVLVAILGILKAGGAYVPIDSKYPESRIRYILEDTKTRLLLTEEKYKEKIKQVIAQAKITAAVICLNSIELQTSLTKYSLENPSINTQPHDLAYVIYTSGTTGKPKGVMMEHKPVLNYIYNLIEYVYGSGKTQHIDYSTNLAFDLTVSTTLGTLLSGNTVCVYTKDPKDIADYIQHLKNHRIEILKHVPSYLDVLVDHLAETDSLDLTKVILGGEKLPKSLLLKTFEKLSINIYEEYGPAETAIGSHTSMINKVASIAEHDLGILFHNYTGYVLDDDLNPLPIGAVGELYIGGDCLARGYLNRQELTRERFIKNPFQTEEEKFFNRNAVIYKTGDLVKLTKNGTYTYVRRNDFQIKINGQRIELGEIESVLCEYPGVSQCSVIVKGQSLIAYYTAQHSISDHLLSNFLKSKLPEYMLPAAFLHLFQFPVTSNGKLNFKALPDVDLTQSTQFEAPRNDQEMAVVSIWASILGLAEEEVSINADFFKLGGNSLSAIRLVAQINKALKTNLKIISIFQHSTIKELVALMQEEKILEEAEI